MFSLIEFCYFFFQNKKKLLYFLVVSWQLHNLSFRGFQSKLRIHIWLFDRKDLKTEEIINCSGIHGVLCAAEFM
ncbi:unnamed protein product [Brassica oleracea var. botrytis]